MLISSRSFSPSLFLGLAAVVLLGAGCTFQQKPSLRLQSFEPYGNHYVFSPEGITEVRSYLSSRTALLVRGDSLPDPDWKDGVFSISDIYLGCAAAIDHRGYFLTAAHCVDDKPVYLIFAEPGEPAKAQRARVVWRGKLYSGEPDLAILHLPRTLNNVFDWSKDPGKDDPVMAVGISKNQKQIHGPQHMGGQILDIGERKGERNGFTVVHDIPLQSGDSGGPLVNAGARLIGINVQGTPPIMRFVPGVQFPRGVAERPDRKWLATIIEKDASTPQPATNEEIFIFESRAPAQN